MAQPLFCADFINRIVRRMPFVALAKKGFSKSEVEVLHGEFGVVRIYL
jgi:hypothetical protein